MGKYKIVVYAIAKNEAKFAEKWAKNMSEADEIYVLLDPTSNDNTKEILENNGVKVTEKLIKPWRFDRARNESLKLVPKDADICVCTDLDELFTPGWRKVLEDAWQPNTNQAVYKYYHNAGTPDDVPNIFDYSKIHDRNTFEWKWAIHEYIVAKNNNPINQVFLPNDVMLKHYPDNKKPRSYKELLEKALKKEKNDTRYLGLLIDEYFNAQEYDKAQKTINRLLSIKPLHIQDICLAYKYLIKIDVVNQNFTAIKQHCYEALSKCDYCKLFYGELGQIYILKENQNELGIALLQKCLSIKQEVLPARETEWNDIAYIYNLISIGYYNLKDYASALMYIDMAIAKNSKVPEYRQNKDLYITANN